MGERLRDGEARRGKQIYINRRPNAGDCERARRIWSGKGGRYWGCRLSWSIVQYINPLIEPIVVIATVDIVSKVILTLRIVSWMQSLETIVNQVSSKHIIRFKQRSTFQYNYRNRLQLSQHATTLDQNVL